MVGGKTLDFFLSNYPKIYLLFKKNARRCHTWSLLLLVMKPLDQKPEELPSAASCDIQRQDLNLPNIPLPLEMYQHKVFLSIILKKCLSILK